MTWQNLTDEEIDEINYTSAHMLAREVEALLKEKNDQKNCTGHRDEHGSRYDPFVRNSGH
jgi:hypothetical protein